MRRTPAQRLREAAEFKDRPGYALRKVAGGVRRWVSTATPEGEPQPTGGRQAMPRQPGSIEWGPLQNDKLPPRNLLKGLTGVKYAAALGEFNRAELHADLERQRALIRERGGRLPEEKLAAGRAYLERYGVPAHTVGNELTKAATPVNTFNRFPEYDSERAVALALAVMQSGDTDTILRDYDSHDQYAMQHRPASAIRAAIAAQTSANTPFEDNLLVTKAIVGSDVLRFPDREDPRTLGIYAGAVQLEERLMEFQQLLDTAGGSLGNLPARKSMNSKSGVVTEVEPVKYLHKLLVRLAKSDDKIEDPSGERTKNGSPKMLTVKGSGDQDKWKALLKERFGITEKKGPGEVDTYRLAAEEFRRLAYAGQLRPGKSNGAMHFKTVLKTARDGLYEPLAAREAFDRDYTHEGPMDHWAGYGLAEKTARWAKTMDRFLVPRNRLDQRGIYTIDTHGQKLWSYLHGREKFYDAGQPHDVLYPDYEGHMLARIDGLSDIYNFDQGRGIYLPKGFKNGDPLPYGALQAAEWHFIRPRQEMHFFTAHDRLVKGVIPKIDPEYLAQNGMDPDAYNRYAGGTVLDAINGGVGTDPDEGLRELTASQRPRLEAMLAAREKARKPKKGQKR